MQINENTEGTPSMGFVRQVKGAGGYASENDIRIPIQPGANWFAVRVGYLTEGGVKYPSKGYWLSTGYELLP